MKTIKRILVIVLIMALCASLYSVAYAKSNKHENNEDNKGTQKVLSADVQTLKTLGLLIGSGKDGLTLEYTKSKPTRIQGFIIYLRLINQELNLTQYNHHDNDANFDDHHGHSSFVKKGMAFAKAHPQYNWVGSNGKFNPMAHLTAKEYAKIMLTALGYEYNTDFSWKNVESFAEELGLNVPKGAFTFEELATMTVQTLYLPMQDSAVTLIAHLASINAEFAAKVALLGTTVNPDASKPTVTDVVLSAPYLAGPPIVNGQVTVYFSEAMKAETLTNLANYVVDLDGSSAGVSSPLSLMLGAAAVPALDNKSVILTIPGSTLNGGIAAGAGITDITVSGLKDLSDNSIATVTKFVRKSASLTVVSSAAIDVNKLQVTFNNPMSPAGDSTEYKLYRSDGTTLASVGTSFVLDTSGKVVTVTLGGILTATAKANELDLTTAKLAIGPFIKDIFGNAVSGPAAVAVVSAATPATVTILDKIAPVITARETQDLDKDGYLDAIKLTFNKNIKDSTVKAGSFDVAGYSSEAFHPGTAADTANNNVIYITFHEANTADTGLTPTIAYTQGTLEDISGNKLASAAAAPAVDKAAPVVMHALPVGPLTAGSTLSSAALILSEDLTAAHQAVVLTAVQAHSTPFDLIIVGDLVTAYVWTTNRQLTVSVTANANGGATPDYIVLTAAAADLLDAALNITPAAQIIK